MQVYFIRKYTCECARAKLIYCSEETKREWTCPFLFWVVGASKSNTVTQLLMIRQQIHSALTMAILLKCIIIRNDFQHFYFFSCNSSGQLFNTKTLAFLLNMYWHLMENKTFRLVHILIYQWYRWYGKFPMPMIWVEDFQGSIRKKTYFLFFLRI